MFVGIFNSEQAKSFVNLAYRVILADEKVTKDEKALINFLEMIVPFDPDIINASATLDELVKPFNEVDSKMFCLLNLYIIALIDEEFEEREKQFIEEISLKFGISSDINKKLLNIAKNLVRSFKEIKDLLEIADKNKK